ncbi:acyltransferase family protein [Nesterenkonia jeotgali]|uniref:Surface polysaccharide O-acyltransferase-like enzyme n=1 Tax=Nesterenkonia jeotgali TaxID=317018 RepID=A0A839FUW2_9MICC|nr:acyltransferase [Nesterenkonia jeotgali]MBA8921633.1 surface polysaccharide O-acyltransferase-like enzyme [Nesterenkonia jeotgali]
MPSTPAHPAPRMQWMDLLRGVAVLLVVVLHGSDIPRANGLGVDEWAQLNLYLEPFRMPLLMFLSGTLLPRSLAKPPALYLWGKFASIVWPLMIWLVGFGVLIYHGGPGRLEYWLTGDYLWFLMALTICYLVGMLLKPAVSRPGPLSGIAVVVFLLMLVTRHFTELENSLVSRTLYYGAFFFLGAACARILLRWATAPWLLIAALAVIMALLADHGLEDREFRAGSLYAAPTAMIGIAVILWVAPRIPAGRINRFMQWTGRNSLVVYVSHFPIIILIHRGLSEIGVDPVLHVAGCTIGGLLMSLLAVWLRPWTRWLYTVPGDRRVASRLAARNQESSQGSDRMRMS